MGQEVRPRADVTSLSDLEPPAPVDQREGANPRPLTDLRIADDPAMGIVGVRGNFTRGRIHHSLPPFGERWPRLFFRSTRPSTLLSDTNSSALSANVAATSLIRLSY